jgi:hypothetical protein
MVDTPEEMAHYRPLAYALGRLGATIVKAYESADRNALRHQRIHRVLTLLAAAFGTAAVLFAIAHLSGLFPAPWPTSVEVAAAAVASFAVLLGIAQARQTKWLLQRHKAEQYRHMKFRSLIDPDLWSGGAGLRRWEDRIDEEAKKIDVLTPQSLHDWIKEQDVAAVHKTVGKIGIERDPDRYLVGSGGKDG